jgi:Glycosyl transferase 4-like domain
VARILVISCTTYGQDSRVKRHAEALVGHGDEVDVLCLENRRNVRSNGVNVIGLVRPRHRRTGTIRGLCYVQFSISAAFNAVRFSLRRRYDVVVVYAVRTATILCAAPLRLHGSRITLDLGDETAEPHQKEKAGRQGTLRARLLVMEEAIRARFANRVIVAHAIHRQLLRNLKIFGSGASNTTRIFSGIPACSEGCADSLGWDHQQRQLLEAIDSLLEKETEARPASESSSGVGAISARRSFRASEAVRWLSGRGMPVVAGGIVRSSHWELYLPRWTPAGQKDGWFPQNQRTAYDHSHSHCLPN